MITNKDSLPVFAFIELASDDGEREDAVIQENADFIYNYSPEEPVTHNYPGAGSETELIGFLLRGVNLIDLIDEETVEVVEQMIDSAELATEDSESHSRSVKGSQVIESTYDAAIEVTLGYFFNISASLEVSGEVEAEVKTLQGELVSVNVSGQEVLPLISPSLRIDLSEKCTQSAKPTKP